MDYGIRINNFSSGSLYSYNLGTRDFLEHKKGVLSNSLFLDFLKENGLNVYKEKSTRDVICIEFTFGTRSFDEELKHLNKSIENWTKLCNKGRITEEVKDKKVSKLNAVIEKTKEHPERYVKKSKEEIRIEWYTKGLSIEYRDHNKAGEVIKTETINYRMLWRTPGKAKKGSCMFIREELYEAAHNFLYMGITLPEHNTPIVEMGAYSALITSSIVGKIQIKPEEILVLDDVDSFFRTRAVCIETDEDKHLVANHMDNYTVCNTMFDGQALIDTSIFPSWAEGYVLLRHHMCKMAAFHTNIQLFFKDYFGKDYETATVADKYGNNLLAKNVKLITTDNAMKWKTFGVSYDYWLEWISKNDYYFGIVKTAHESKLGNIQQMSYQMINALDVKIMEDVLQCSKKYLDDLKNKDEFFLQYLESKMNFSNDFEVLLALCRHNKNFINTDYCRERRHVIIKAITMQLRTGKVLQEGDNLVLVGSPYAMLLHSVGEDVERDTTFEKEANAIQCYSERFEFGEYLAGFRSPFNSKNNLDYLHNVDSPEFHKYFQLGKLVIAVNVCHTDFEDRNNGSDFDSDSLFVTNHKAIVDHAKICYLSYPTIVNNIPKEKNIYDNTLENYAVIDNTLASYQRAIGESSNLAQIAQTYSYNNDLLNFEEDVLDDYACILAVVAQIAIDSAKRKFDVDVLKEISRIRENLNIQENGYPEFYADVQNKKLVGVNMRNKYKDPQKFNVEITFTDKEEAEVYVQECISQGKYAAIDGDEDEDEIAKNSEEQDNKIYKVTEKVNKKLKCPMNRVRDEIKVRKAKKETIPFADILVTHKIEQKDIVRRSRKVEALIEKYILGNGKDVYLLEKDKLKEESIDEDSWLLYQEDFDSLICDIRESKLSHNYAGLMYWLICRAFNTSNVHHAKFQTQLNKNRPVLLSVLYAVNNKAFLECFEKA